MNDKMMQLDWIMKNDEHKIIKSILYSLINVACDQSHGVCVNFEPWGI